MDLVLVTLCGFCTFQAKIMVGESEFVCNRTFPAGAARVF